MILACNLWKNRYKDLYLTMKLEKVIINFMALIYFKLSKENNFFKNSLYIEILLIV